MSNAAEGSSDNNFGDLFSRVTVMHASAVWSQTSADLTAVLGDPTFSDGGTWAAWAELSVSDEADGPAWSLLAKTSDLDAVAARAVELGWAVGQRSQGGHETRLALTSPAGLSVIAYMPTSGS